MILKQATSKAYSTRQYANGVHEMSTQINVKTASGKVVKIFKTKTNRGLGDDLWSISGGVTRKSKGAMVNWLKAN